MHRLHLSSTHQLHRHRCHFHTAVAVIGICSLMSACLSALHRLELTGLWKRAVDPGPGEGMARLDHLYESVGCLFSLIPMCTIQEDRELWMARAIGGEWGWCIQWMIVEAQKHDAEPDAKGKNIRGIGDFEIVFGERFW